MYVVFHVKYSLLLSDFKIILNFLDRFSKNTPISNFVEILSVGTELFHADRRTDMMKEMVSFRNFAKAPKPGYGISRWRL